MRLNIEEPENVAQHWYNSGQKYLNEKYQLTEE